MVVKILNPEEKLHLSQDARTRLFISAFELTHYKDKYKVY